MTSEGMPGASCSALQQRSLDLDCRRNRKTWQSSPSIPVINITKTDLKFVLLKTLYFILFDFLFLLFNINSSSVACNANSNLLACKTQIKGFFFTSTPKFTVTKNNLKVRMTSNLIYCH